MEIDNVFLEIGESGRQQIKYGLMLCLAKMYHPLHTLQYNFVARQTGFRFSIVTHQVTVFSVYCSAAGAISQKEST